VYHFAVSAVLNPPYPGQGESIPTHLGRGTWIIRNLAILFDDALPNDPAAEMRPALPPLTASSVNPILVFNAPGIAALAGVLPAHLIEVNRKKTLQIENQLLRSSPDGTHTMRFFFTIDGRTCAFTADVAQPS
jgi:hypothetical protein